MLEQYGSIKREVEELRKDRADLLSSVKEFGCTAQAIGKCRRKHKITVKKSVTDTPNGAK